MITQGEGHRHMGILYPPNSPSGYLGLEMKMGMLEYEIEKSRQEHEARKKEKEFQERFKCGWRTPSDYGGDWEYNVWLRKKLAEVGGEDSSRR